MSSDKVSQVQPRIDKNLWRLARSAAVKGGITIAAWIADAMREKLEREEVSCHDSPSR